MYTPTFPTSMKQLGLRDGITKCQEQIKEAEAFLSSLKRDSQGKWRKNGKFVAKAKIDAMVDQRHGAEEGLKSLKLQLQKLTGRVWRDKQVRGPKKKSHSRRDREHTTPELKGRIHVPDSVQKMLAQ